MQQGRSWLRIAVLICAGIALSGCTLSDSLRHDDFRSVWARPDNASIEQTLFFVTDREADDSALGYGLHWSSEAHCGIAQVSIPTAFQWGKPPRWAKAGKPRTIACDDERDLGAFAHAVAAAAGEKKCDRVLLYVHGYNATFQTALYRGAQLATDTEWSCVTAVLSWSSEAKFDRYVADVERSGYAVPLLMDMVRELHAAGLKVEFMTQSMGSRIALNAVAALCGRHRAAFVDQLLLVAPDVNAEHDNDDFGHLLRHGAPCIHRATIYASSNDLILIASEGVHGGIPRAGRLPERDLQYAGTGLPDTVDVIDASNAPGDPMGHGYFVLSYEMLADMMWTLAGVPPAARAAAEASGGPTLVCADTASPCTRYALKVAKDRGPDFKTRMLRRIWPIIFSVQ